MSSIKTFYDGLYSKNPSIFPNTSSVVLDEVLKLVSVSPGKAVDLGAGEGLASIYLARKGFSVLAIDISDYAFSAIRKLELPIITEHLNVEEFFPTCKYSVVCSFFSFHHLNTAEAAKLLKRLQLQTERGGIHVFRFITKNSDFFRENTSTQNFYPNREEVESFYTDWNIIIDRVEISRAATSGALNESLTFVAQRR